MPMEKDCTTQSNRRALASAVPSGTWLVLPVTQDGSPQILRLFPFVLKAAVLGLIRALPAGRRRHVAMNCGTRDPGLKPWAKFPSRSAAV